MTAEGLITWAVGAIIGVLEVPIFEWIKAKLGIADKVAFLVVMLFSVLLAVIALFVTGGFSPFDINKLFEYTAAIIVLSQLTYKMWRG